MAVITEPPPNTAACLERLKAEVQAKLEASNPDRKRERCGEGFHSSLLMALQLVLSHLDPMPLAELREDVLQRFKQERKLHATVHRMGGFAYFIITTKPPPTWNIKNPRAWAAKLVSWAWKKLGPDGISYGTLGIGTAWANEDEATTPVTGALKDVLERISVPLSMVTRDLMTQLLMACTRIVLPESYRDGAFPLRPLNWSLEEKAIMMTIDIPLAYATRAGSDDQIQRPYGYDFEVAIPSDTPDECADLKADPFFHFNFSEDADKHATDAQKALAKFIYAQCARYALSQYEAVVLAQALLNQHTRKYSSLIFSRDIIELPPPDILHEYRTYMPDLFGVGGLSQDIRDGISRYASLVVDEYFSRQQKGECKHGLVTEWKSKVREQRAVLQQRMSKMRSKLSNSIMSGMRSGLMKLARGKSDSLEQLMETRLDNLEREVKARADGLEREVMARVDGLEREVKNRLELLESMPTEKAKQELKDFIKKP